MSGTFACGVKLILPDGNQKCEQLILPHTPSFLLCVSLTPYYKKSFNISVSVFINSHYIHEKYD